MRTDPKDHDLGDEGVEDGACIGANIAHLRAGEQSLQVFEDLQKRGLRF